MKVIIKKYKCTLTTRWPLCAAVTHLDINFDEPNFTQLSRYTMANRF